MFKATSLFIAALALLSLTSGGNHSLSQAKNTSAQVITIKNTAQQPQPPAASQVGSESASQSQASSEHNQSAASKAKSTASEESNRQQTTACFSITTDGAISPEKAARRLNIPAAKITIHDRNEAVAYLTQKEPALQNGHKLHWHAFKYDSGKKGHPYYLYANDPDNGQEIARYVSPTGDIIADY
ncbi:hypothetical protein [Lactobacillus selangorensis]|nr:hypothetical protein [Lactobacillus selangorensis]